MIIYGNRRGNAKQLAEHLLKTEENESVKIVDINGFSFHAPSGKNLEKALNRMERQGYAKGNAINLYHVFFAPMPGETLKPEQVKFMMQYYAMRQGLEDHQFVVVEHWKKGKQHFHAAFNVTNSVTGNNAALKYDGKRNRVISREIEKILGLSSPSPKGKAPKHADMQRGKRGGLDPRAMTAEVTQIFNQSETGAEFVKKLAAAGYDMARGRNGSLVLVDKQGDIHGLLRRIKGVRLVNLRRKFPDLFKMQFEDAEKLAAPRRPIKFDKIPAAPKAQGAVLAAGGSLPPAPALKIAPAPKKMGSVSPFMRVRPLTVLPSAGASIVKRSRRGGRSVAAGQAAGGGSRTTNAFIRQAIAGIEADYQARIAAVRGDPKLKPHEMQGIIERLMIERNALIQQKQQEGRAMKAAESKELKRRRQALRIQQAQRGLT